jgi:protein SCO1/2
MMKQVPIYLLMLLSLASLARADEPIPAAMQGAGVEEKLGNSLPLDATFTDETGKEVKLRDILISGKPAVLQLSYFRCPMLCETVSQGLLRAMQDLDLEMGSDFTAINISFDPKDTPADAYLKKKNFVQQYNRPGGGSWRFLVGNKPMIDSVCNAVGFKYQFDPATDQFAHPAALMVISPDGRVMRYLYGVEYPKTTLRLSLVEASEGKIGSTIDKVMMLCFRYSPVEGRYTFFAMGLMRVAGVFTVLVLGVILGRQFLKERRARQATV